MKTFGIKHHLAGSYKFPAADLYRRVAVKMVTLKFSIINCSAYLQTSSSQIILRICFFDGHHTLRKCPFEDTFQLCGRNIINKYIYFYVAIYSF